MGKSKVKRKLLYSKVLIFSLITSFIFLIVTDASPRKRDFDSDEEFKPIVRVKEAKEAVSPAQKERFERLIEDGKKLLLDDMDYEGALGKFSEAENLAITREQKADVLYYLSLAYFSSSREARIEGCAKAIRELIEIDYYRELDELLCPPRYIELYEEIKREYGALKVQSKPAGADVYLNDSTDPVGQTPITIGSKAGTVRIRLKKGKKEKKDSLIVTSGKETATPMYTLKGKSGLIYIIGGIVLTGGAGAALLSGGKGNGGGTSVPSSGPTTGSIQVNSSPTGAKVYLDGNDTGETTNCTLTNISIGTHSLKLELELYGKWEGEVEVKGGQTTNVDVSLAPFKYELVLKLGSYGSDNGQFDEPRGVAVDSPGYIYVADSQNCRIQKFNPSGYFVTKWGNWGTGNGQFYSAEGLAIDSSDVIYVADSAGQRIQKFTSDGDYIFKWGSGGSGNGQFNYPWGIAVEDSDYVYVADYWNHRIQKFDSYGNYITWWGGEGGGDGQLYEPRRIAIDSSGYVYVVDEGNDRVQVFTSSGDFVAKWGSRGSGDGQFNYPCGIAVDSSGYVYVADAGNNRIQKFTSRGDFVAKWGSNGTGDGQFRAPQGIAIDGADNVYVADTANHRIQKFQITTETMQTAKISFIPINGNALKKNLGIATSLLNQSVLEKSERKQRLINKRSIKSGRRY